MISVGRSSRSALAWTATVSAGFSSVAAVNGWLPGGLATLALLACLLLSLERRAPVIRVALDLEAAAVASVSHTSSRGGEPLGPALSSYGIAWLVVLIVAGLLPFAGELSTGAEALPVLALGLLHGSEAFLSRSVKRLASVRASAWREQLDPSLGSTSSPDGRRLGVPASLMDQDASLRDAFCRHISELSSADLEEGLLWALRSPGLSRDQATRLWEGVVERRQADGAFDDRLDHVLSDLARESGRGGGTPLHGVLLARFLTHPSGRLRERASGLLDRASFTGLAEWEGQALRQA